MSIFAQTRDLRQRLNMWAASPEWSLMVRYELLPQKPAPLLIKRLDQRFGRLLRVCGLSRERYKKQTWVPGLKHASAPEGARTLLVWSDITDINSSRNACINIRVFLESLSGYCPVLITSIADFAFYSRLGWLVEYLPELPENGQAYKERKQCWLAWRYRDAVAIPLSAGFEKLETFTQLLQENCCES